MPRQFVEDEDDASANQNDTASNDAHKKFIIKCMKEQKKFNALRIFEEKIRDAGGSDAETYGKLLNESFAEAADQNASQQSAAGDMINGDSARYRQRFAHSESCRR